MNRTLWEGLRIDRDYNPTAVLCIRITIFSHQDFKVDVFLKLLHFVHPCSKGLAIVSKLFFCGRESYMGVMPSVQYLIIVPCNLHAFVEFKSRSLKETDHFPQMLKKTKIAKKFLAYSTDSMLMMYLPFRERGL